MTALAAWPITISAGDTPVTLTNEAASLVSPGVYRITNAVHARLDPATTVTIKVDTVTQAPGTYTVDYLFGVVTFDSAPAGGSVVTVSGKYIPVVALSLAKEATISVTNDVVELGVFGNEYKTRQSTLADFSGSITGLALVNEALGDSDLQAKLTDGSPLLIEISKSAVGGSTFRAWIQLQSLDEKLSSASLLESTIKFIGHSFQSEDGDWVAWGYN